MKRPTRWICAALAAMLPLAVTPLAHAGAIDGASTTFADAITSTPSTGSPTSAPAAQAAAPSAALQHDAGVAFRQTHGLPSDATSVQTAEAAARPGAATQPFGVALSPPELTTMQDRMNFQGSFDALRADVHDNPSAYGGIWLDTTTGHLIINESPTTDHTKLTALLATNKIDTSRVEFRTVAKSLAQLDGDLQAFVKTESPKLAQRGLKVVSAYPHMQTNDLTVGIENLSPADQQSLSASYPGVTFFSSQPYTAVDDRTNSSGPWKVGMEIYNQQPHIGFCTAGFSVVDGSGHRFVVTAGHCNGAGSDNPDVQDHSVSSWWHHNWNTTYPLTENYFLNGAYADASLINPPDFVNSNLAILDVSQNGNVTASRAWSAVGDTVCTSGATTTYWRCGVVTAVGGWNTYDNTSVQSMATADFSPYAGAAGGDSGSGIFYTNGTTPSPGVRNLTAQGIMGAAILGGNKVVFSQLGSVFYEMSVRGHGTSAVATTPRPQAFQVASAPNSCLDIPGGSQTDGTALQEWTCSGVIQQSYYIYPAYNYWSLVSRASYKCVDVRGASQSNSAIIQQWGCFSPPALNQMFSFVKSVDASQPDFQIVNLNSSRCIDVLGGYQTNGTTIQQYDCAAGGGPLGNQRFRNY